MAFGLTLIGLAGGVVVYAYLLYPLCLKVLAMTRRPRLAMPLEGEWPTITITIPVHNEAGQVRDLLESVLRLEYPRDRMQVLVVSDASTDGTDEIVQSYADRGIELLRMPVRSGKSAAENAARGRLRGEIIVNTDASIRIHPGALKPLISQFFNPTVGLASGRDVSVTSVEGERNQGESSYVGYEMWLRSLETDVYGIVGASGCFYAIRRELHDLEVPPGLSRDFAAALNTRERGYRAVTVNEAVCYVPRVASLRREYRRKVRTIARGMATLHYKRSLMNPWRYGVFAWMLASHKVGRWAAPWAALPGFVGLLFLAPISRAAAVLAAVALVVVALGALGWAWPEHRRPPRLLRMPAFLLAANVAVLHATLKALRGDQQAVWEPTRRERAPEGAPAVPAGN